MDYVEYYYDFFVQRLVQLRKAAGISARELSLSLAMSESYIGKLEKKKSKPSLDVLLLICDYFNMTPEDFFSGSATDPELTRKLINLVRHIPQEKQQSLLSLLESGNQ